MDLPDYDVDFSISDYDRPLLAMSNLLLRGDIDAATRSIFTPETLSPREMQTMRTQLAGPRPNAFVKTVLDVATNPLVILGVVGGYLIYPSAGPAALLKMYQGLSKAPPIGAIGRFTTGAFARLRQYPGLHGKIMAYGRDSLQFSSDWTERFKAAYGKLPGAAAGRSEGHLMNLRMRGFTNPNAGFQHTLGRHGASTAPLLDKSRAVLDPKYIGAEAKTRNVADAIWGELKKDKQMWAAVEAEAKSRGLTTGDYLKDYVPTHVQPNRWRRAYAAKRPPAAAAKDVGPEPLSRNVLANRWDSIPDPDQLRALEGKGVRVGATDDMLRGVQQRVATFEGRLTDAVNKVMHGPNADRRLREYLYHEGKDGKVTGLLARTQGGEDLAHLVSQQVWAARQMKGDVPKIINEMANLVKQPGTYSLDFAPTWERYLSRMAPTYSWHLKGHGPAILDKVDEFKRLGTWRPQDEKYVMQDLLPYMTGKKSPTGFAQSVNLREWGFRRAEWLRTHPLAKQVVPEKSRQWLIKRLETPAFGDLDAHGHSINHWLYLSTMGANIGPPSKNIFQNLITVAAMPGLGFTALAKGGGEVFLRTGKYLRDAGKLGAEQSFRKHFSDFVEMMGPSLDLGKMFSAVPAGEQTLATAAKTGWGKFEAALMAPFKASEMMNRLTGFYGARAQALTWPGVPTGSAGAALANKIAANVVEIAHFPGGPTGIPAGTLNWWAPFRQFTQFPLRYAGMLTESVRWGENPASFNPGTLFRAMAGSTAAYTVAKNLLGADISQSLLLGALPLPQYEQAPFYPFPLVAPLPQMVGNVAMAAMGGDPRRLTDTATLLVPGGLAVRRLAATLGPKRADYEHRLPDGRIPVYNEQNRLIGAYTPLQLGLRALGIMPTGWAQERGAAQWLAGQRDQIRQYRQQWLDAHLQNDPVSADKVQSEFQRRYPELGPLEFKKSDIHAIEQRRQVGRVNRILRGFPKAYKPLFENIVNEATLGAAVEDIGRTYTLPPGLAALQ